MNKMPKTLLVITGLLPDDLVGAKSLWLNKQHLAAKGYSAIYLVVCGDADFEKRTGLLDNIPASSWQPDLECRYYVGTLNCPEPDARFAKWCDNLGALSANIEDAIVIASCEDLLPVLQHKDCKLKTIFNQGGRNPTTKEATFNWYKIVLTQAMFNAVDNVPGCSYYLVNSEFVKSNDDGYPFKKGTINEENSIILHPALMKDKAIKQSMVEWNEIQMKDPSLPPQIRVLLDKPMHFMPADVFVVYAFLVNCGVWQDPKMQWTQYKTIEIQDDRKVKYVQDSSEHGGRFNIIKSLGFNEFEQQIANAFEEQTVSNIELSLYVSNMHM